MERPKKKEIDWGKMGISDSHYNQALTDYDLWLKEKLDGLEGVIYKYLLNTEIGKQLNGKVDCADLASAIRKEFER